MPPDAINPYRPPASNVTPPRPIITPRDCPGIGRLACFAAVFLISLAGSFVTDQGGSPGWGMFVLALNLLPAQSRLVNIGLSPWWGFFTLVPIINLLLILPCFALPAGYRDHRRLDLAAVIAGVPCLLFILLIFYLFFQLLFHGLPGH